jgi:plasmid stabilization system protein ParE
MFKVEIAKSAELDLQSAYSWYSSNASDQVAQLWKQEILKKAKSLSHMPRRCPFAPEHFSYKAELRLTRCFSHLLIFTIVEDRVIVLRVRHLKQNVL